MRLCSTSRPLHTMEGASDPPIQPQEPSRNSNSHDVSFNKSSIGDQFNAVNSTQNIYTQVATQWDPVQACLQSLAFEGMDRRYWEIGSPAPGTCEWVFQHPKYTAWASSDRGLLWIKGIPGCGKSKLMQYILNNCRNSHGIENDATVLSFFFHASGNEYQKTPLGLFRSLLHQILSTAPETAADLIATFKKRCRDTGGPGEKWHWDLCELQALFTSSLKAILRTRSVWLLVDALDECGKESARELAEDFEFLLQLPLEQGMRDFRICFACRHYPNLCLRTASEIQVELENRRDISIFVRSTLLPTDKRELSFVQDSIIDGAGGVFLWASLMVKRVRDQSLDGVRLNTEVTQSDVSKLDDMYRDMIKKMDSDSLRLIQWVCFAERPLTLAEIRWALLIAPDCPHKSLHESQATGSFSLDNDDIAKRINSLGRGLVEVTADARVVQFIHLSVRDFFIREGLNALASELNAPDTKTRKSSAEEEAHYNLSRTCFLYFSMDEIARSSARMAELCRQYATTYLRSDHDRRELTTKYPLLEYAAEFCITHMNRSGGKFNRDDLVKYLLWPSENRLQLWVRIYCVMRPASWLERSPRKQSTFLHIASKYRLTKILEIVLTGESQFDIDLNARDCEGRSPLSYAAEFGYDDVAKQLLATRKASIISWAYLLAKCKHRKRDVKIDSADFRGRTPLHWAAERGREAFVQLLLERGATIDIADRDGLTPLHVAVGNRYRSIICLLLGRGADVNAATKDGLSPLHYATKTFHYESVSRPQCLGEDGREVDSADTCNLEAFHQEPPLRRDAIVRTLLENGANVDLADKYGLTPLHWAAAWGQEAVVRLLIQKGAGTKPRKDVKSAESPLYCAARYGHEGIVKLLLDKGKQM